MERQATAAKQKLECVRVRVCVCLRVCNKRERMEGKVWERKILHPLCHNMMDLAGNTN